MRSAVRIVSSSANVLACDVMQLKQHAVFSQYRLDCTIPFGLHKLQTAFITVLLALHDYIYTYPVLFMPSVL